MASSDTQVQFYVRKVLSGSFSEDIGILCVLCRTYYLDVRKDLEYAPKSVNSQVVLYGCETWTLTLKEEHRLRVFENKVLRKIFGAKRDEVTGEWRKLHNAELHALYSSPDIIRNIKSRCLRWAGHKKKKKKETTLGGKKTRSLRREGKNWRRKTNNKNEDKKLSSSKYYIRVTQQLLHSWATQNKSKNLKTPGRKTLKSVRRINSAVPFAVAALLKVMGNLQCHLGSSASPPREVEDVASPGTVRGQRGCYTV
ncbi:hypothetical protein ANN_02475 [Periplaneta americana]|uniref:Uncharacterized protein n=1 Tax=Periplaneta americana TaxID=6978 RepID=A0ABQ8TZV1_PERAM|nr:hypothetical protein ANN_02475 [Periplaneta americana]